MDNNGEKYPDDGGAWMNRKLGRLLEPGMDLFFIVMLIFSVGAMVAGSLTLAMLELVATGALFAY